MKNTKGFTLIEMVVVIVILGILASTAAPKFLNLQSDARVSTLKGAEGAIRAADGIVFGKAAIKGVENQPRAEFKAGDTIIETSHGHIFNTKINIENAANLDGYLVHEFTDFWGDDYTAVTQADKWDDNNQCHVQIYQDEETGELEFTQVTDGC